MAEFKGTTTLIEKCPQVLEEIVEVLFSQNPTTSWTAIPYVHEGDNGGKRQISHEELLRIAKNVIKNEDSGLYGIPESR